MKLKIHKAKHKTPPQKERVIRYKVKDNEIRELWFCSVKKINNGYVWECGDLLQDDDLWSQSVVEKEQR
jgi:hypothetical protein